METNYLATKGAVLNWMIHSNYQQKRRFILGLIHRIKSDVLIEKIYFILSPIAHKDLVYSRSQCASNQTGNRKTSLRQIMCKQADVNLYMTNTWKWFATADVGFQTTFICQVIDALCGLPVLIEAYNMVKVIYTQQKWEQEKCKVSVPDSCCNLTDSIGSFETDQHPELYLLASAKASYGRLFETQCSKRNNGHDTISSEESVSELSSEQSDPCRSVINTSSKALSGIASYKDFIACLPIHLAKKILSLLDAKTLSKTKCVSKQWNKLSAQINVEELVSQDINEESIMMQDVSVKTNPNEAYYSTQLNIAVPHCTTKFEKERIVTYHMAEERNIYCSAYNVLVLNNEFDSKRVVHFCEGNVVACGSENGAIQVLDITTGQQLFPPLRCHPGPLTAIHISHQDHVVVYSGSYDTTIRRWHVGSSACKQIMYGHRDSITCLDLDGTYLVSGSKDGLVKLWNTLTGKCVCTFRHAKHIAVNCVKLSNNVIVSSCDKGVIKVWCCKARKLRKVLLGHHGPVNDLSVDDFFIISGSNDGYVMSWTKETDYKNLVRSFRHPKGVLCVQLMYLRVVSGCMDGKIRVFNLISGGCLRVIRGNSNCDPILSLHATSHRLIVNTVSSLLLMQFEEVKRNLNPDDSNILTPPQHQTSLSHKASTTKVPNRRSYSATLQRTVNPKGIKQGVRNIKSAMGQKDFQALSHDRNWINYPSYFVSIFSLITPEVGKKEVGDQCIKGSVQPTFNNRLKDGTFLRIRNLQRSTGNSPEDICTMINAAPTDTRELLQRSLHRNTAQMESWISTLHPSDLFQPCQANVPFSRATNSSGIVQQRPKTSSS